VAKKADVEHDEPMGHMLFRNLYCLFDKTELSAAAQQNRVLMDI
jgi:hypothetical protein